MEYWIYYTVAMSISLYSYFGCNKSRYSTVAGAISACCDFFESVQNSTVLRRACPDSGAVSNYSFLCIVFL